jgi:hypothetical protein
MYILDEELDDHDGEIFMLLANGWTATHTVQREFRINNGPPEDLAILERLVEAGLVMKCTGRTYAARVYLLAAAYMEETRRLGANFALRVT